MLCNNNGKVEVLLERISKWPSQSIFPINLPCQNCDLLDISKYYVRGNLLLMALLEDVCLFGMREMEALVRFPSLALVVHEEIGRVEWKGERYLKRRITITMHFLVRIESKSEGEFLMLIQLNPWAEHQQRHPTFLSDFEVGQKHVNRSLEWIWKLHTQ